LPSVHSPKENLSAGFAWYALLALMEFPRWVNLNHAYLKTKKGLKPETCPNCNRLEMKLKS
jgi:hypothetical protein